MRICCTGWYSGYCVTGEDTDSQEQPAGDAASEQAPSEAMRDALVSELLSMLYQFTESKWMCFRVFLLDDSVHFIMCILVKQYLQNIKKK